MEEPALYLATGAAAGVSAGMLGIGGRLIIVPILALIFTAHGVSPDRILHPALELRLPMAAA